MPLPVVQYCQRQAVKKIRQWRSGAAALFLGICVYSIGKLFLGLINHLINHKE